MKSAREVTELIEQQLARISQVELVECIRPLLVTPRLEHRAWDYGQPDQTFPCWIALEHKPSQTAVAYCEEGFGPTLKTQAELRGLKGPAPPLNSKFWRGRP